MQEANQFIVRLAFDRRRRQPQFQRIAVHAREFGSCCTRLYMEHKNNGTVAITAPCAVVHPMNAFVSDDSSHVTGNCNASCARTITIKGERSSVPPIGWTILRPGRKNGNV